MTMVIADMMAPIEMTVFVFVVLIVLYQMMKTKVQIFYPDGSYIEKLISRKAIGGSLDMGEVEGVYNLRKEGFHTKLLFGVLPQSRIVFLSGCPEPVAFHSGEPVLYPTDLMIPVTGEVHCDKCGSTKVKIVKLLMAPFWRIMLLEQAMKLIGHPKKKGIDMKTLMILGVIMGVIIIGAVIASKMMAPHTTAGPITPTVV